MVFYCVSIVFYGVVLCSYCVLLCFMTLYGVFCVLFEFARPEDELPSRKRIPPRTRIPPPSPQRTNSSLEYHLLETSLSS